MQYGVFREQQEEVGELQIRIGMVEKRLENVSKEADDKVDKIQQKLDEATITMKKKEKFVSLAMLVTGSEVWGVNMQYCGAGLVDYLSGCSGAHAII